MRAVTAEDHQVVVAERPDPSPQGDELLVRIRAAGLNRADLGQLRGRYPAPPGWPENILGLECAGEIIALGRGVTRFAIGDRVMAVVGGGGQAELITFSERLAIPVPDAVDWVAAGGTPEAFTTAADALFAQAGLAAGDRLLVHGAAGGVGVAAVQLGVLTGASVTATVRDPEARRSVADLGADAIEPEGFERRGPFDVILELVGASNMDGNLASLATGGRICLIAVQTGAESKLDFMRLMVRQGRIHGSTLRARPLEAKAAGARMVERVVLPGLAAGRLTVPIAAEHPLADAASAYRDLERPGKVGKVVLTV